MGIIELALIGVGLSMDAFAVSICKGLSMKKVDVKYMVVLAIFFGGFQAFDAIYRMVSRKPFSAVYCCSRSLDSHLFCLQLSAER